MSYKVEQGECPHCGSSDAFTIYPDGHTHCYSCGKHEHGGYSLEYIRDKYKASVAKSDIRLPSDFDYYIPLEPKQWLEKYGITSQERIQNKIGYSSVNKRLIFPLYDYSLGHMVGWQGRDFSENVEKSRPKWYGVGMNNDIIHLPKNHNCGKLVVVEDPVSAIKVSRVVTAMPMLGSNIGLERARKLSSEFKEAVVWMDSDKRKASILVASTLSQLGLTSTVLFTDLDPKCYSQAEIRELVK